MREADFFLLRRAGHSVEESWGGRGGQMQIHATQKMQLKNATREIDKNYRHGAEGFRMLHPCQYKREFQSKLRGPQGNGFFNLLG